MPDLSNNESFPIKQTVADALRTMRPVRTPHCLEPDVMLELAEQGIEEPYNPAMRHVAECSLCRSAYLRLRADLLEAEELRAGSSTAAAPLSAPVTPVRPDGKSENPLSSPSWWECLTHPRRLVPAFGTVIMLLVFLAFGPLRVAQKRYAAERDHVARLEKQWTIQQNQLQIAEASREGNQASLSSTVRDLKAQLTSREQQLNRVQNQRSAEQIRLQNQITQLQKRLEAGQRTTGGTLLDRVRSYQIARVDPRELRALRVPSDELRGDASEGIQQVELISPVATYVFERRPWLRWKPVPKTVRYVVTLARNNGRSTVEETTLGKKTTTWRPEQELVQGVTFDWQVAALDADGKTIARSRARFVTKKDGAALPEIAAALLELGRLYERAGLLDEAERAYAAVSDTEPQYRMAQQRLRTLAARRSPTSRP